MAKEPNYQVLYQRVLPERQWWRATAYHCYLGYKDIFVPVLCGKNVGGFTTVSSICNYSGSVFNRKS